MVKLTRFGISISDKLLKRFDEFISEKGYSNRSEAIRDLIRDQLVTHDWQVSGVEVAGTVTLVYDHHVRGLPEQLLSLQHDYHDMILSTMHIHLDHDHCLEVLVVKGPSEHMEGMVNRLTSVKGVKHGKFTMTSTGEE